MNVLSLFDGMSCGRLALERAGIPVTNYYASEIDKYAIQVSKANWPDIHHLGDVQLLNYQLLPKIDLLIGGSPCQGFSFAGKQLNFSDPRSALFFEFVHALKTLKPKYFMLENVKMKKEYLDVISQQLGVKPIFINSALVSAQNRQRYYWCNWKLKQPEDKGILLKDILESDGTGWIKNHGQYAQRNEKSQCLNANYHKCADNHGQRTLIKCGAMIGRKINPDTGKRDDYNKDLKTEQRIEVRQDEKTNCLTTVQKDNLVVRAYNRKDGLKQEIDKAYCLNASDWRGLNRNQTQNAVTSGMQYRKLTPIECERLQTVPDNYTNHVSNTQRYKMLGNGWTVDVIAHIFKQLKP